MPDMPEIQKKKQEIKEYIQVLKTLCNPEQKERILKSSYTYVQRT